MATGVTVWSKTAASNNTADSAVNWAEGQAPSSVNDSARGMMAATAKWRDDLNGSVATAGSSTAYTATSNQTFASLTAGIEIACQFDEDCGATVTLNVDGLGAKPLRSAAGVELVAGAIKAGSVHRATYFTSNSGEWLLHDVSPTILADSQVATAKIADGAVTYAKMQDVSVTSRVLGRKTSGAGDAEELTLSDVLDFVGSATRGDILIRGASSWTRLAIGGSGSVITSDGTDVGWGASPAMFRIATVTAANSPTVSFTSGIDSTYREYMIGIDAAIPQTDSTSFFMEVSVDGGSSWKTTSYLGGPWSFNTGGGQTNIASTSNFALSRTNVMSNTSSNGWSGQVSLHAPSATGNKIMVATGGHLVTGGTIFENVQGAGSYNGVTTAINAVRFRFSSGNVASGVFALYGIK